MYSNSSGSHPALPQKRHIPVYNMYIRTAYVTNLTTYSTSPSTSELNDNKVKCLELENNNITNKITELETTLKRFVIGTKLRLR